MKTIQRLSGFALLAGLGLAGYWFFAPLYTQALYGVQGFISTSPEPNGNILHHITALAGDTNLQANRLIGVIFGLGISLLGTLGLAASHRFGVGTVSKGRTRPV